MLAATSHAIVPLSVINEGRSFSLCCLTNAISFVPSAKEGECHARHSASVMRAFPKNTLPSFFRCFLRNAFANFTAICSFYWFLLPSFPFLISRPGNFGVRCGECCVCKLVTYIGKLAQSTIVSETKLHSGHL